MRVAALLLILSASFARADDALDRLAADLASEDPAVRAAARSQLLKSSERRVPAIRAAAANATDAEARAALLEIAETIAEGRPMQVATEWARRALRNDMLLDDVEGWEISPIAVFCCWMTRGEEIAAQAAADPDRPWLDQKPDVRLLAKAGAHWLEAYTLAKFGDDLEAWKRFREKVQDWSWAEIRLEGLVERGYRVRDGDANVAVAEFLRAGRRWRSGDSRESFVKLVSAVFKGRPGEGEPSDEERLLDWIEACGSTFAREGDRFVTSAGAEEFLSAVRHGSDGVALAALAELERWPDRVPEEAWRLAEANVNVVTRVMEKARLRVPRDRLPGVLRALGSESSARGLAAIWKHEDLSSLAQDREADPDDRVRAIRFLARLDREAAAAAGRGVLDAYAREPHADEHAVARAAALAAADSGAKEALDGAEAWLKIAPENYERIDVALLLARHGRRAGFDLIVDRAARDLLDRRRCAKARKFIEGAPSAENDDEWGAWAGSETGDYAWDPASKKWRR